MKKILLIATMTFLFFLNSNVYALTVDNNNIEMKSGTDLEVPLYVNLEEKTTDVSFYMVYFSYNFPAVFTSNPLYKETITENFKHNITFNKPVSGKIELGTIKISAKKGLNVGNGTIKLYNGVSTTELGGTKNLDSQTLAVSINNNVETDTKAKTDTKIEGQYNYLKSIESKIVNLNIQDNVYEYTIDIKEDVTELDLKPIPVLDNYEVNVSSQKISELDDGKIIITISSDQYITKYTVKVNVVKETKTTDEKDTETDESKSNFEYKSKWIASIIVLSFILFIGIIVYKKNKRN